MTIVRIAHIPLDELYLLPVSDLRRQIREDGNRLRSPNGGVDQEGRTARDGAGVLTPRSRPRASCPRPKEVS